MKTDSAIWIVFALIVMAAPFAAITARRAANTYARAEEVLSKVER